MSSKCMDYYTLVEKRTFNNKYLIIGLSAFDYQ